MSGSTIGGVVGGVVGFFFGNPQLGWMIGSAIGGYVDPEQISQFGPRLTDASQQTARDGIPIPYGYGSFPCHGNLIWCSDIAEHVNQQTDDGKGSGVETTTTTYTYTRSYAIGICQGEIAGLLVIKRNGKIVYDARTDAELTARGYTAQQIAEARASAASAGLRFTIYTGSNTQTADPTMEAHFGVGNVTAYRGLAYIVVTDDDVTELRGAVPQFEFVVRSTGTVNAGWTGATWIATDGSGNFAISEGGTDWSSATFATAGLGSKLAYGNGVLVCSDATYTGYSTDLALTWTASTLDDPDIGARYPNNIDYIGGKFWIPAGLETASSSGSGQSFTSFAGMAGVTLGVSGHPGLIVFGSNVDFVTVSTDGGATWGLRDIGGTSTECIGTNGSRVMIGHGAGGATGRTSYTDDGDTFSSQVLLPTSIEVPANVTGNGSTWVLVGSGSVAGVGIAYSTDGGATWATPTLGFDFAGKSIRYHDGLWVAVGRRTNSPAGPVILTSTDAINWTVRANTFGVSATVTDVIPIPCEGMAIPGAPGWYVTVDGEVCGGETDTITDAPPDLADIVAAEFQRVGLTSDDYDVSDLVGIDVLGYRVLPNGSGVDAGLGPLMQAHFFDIAEWDGKLRCVLRGGASSLSLTMDDLAERDGEAIEWTRVQEAELLRLQTVAYIDPAAGYSPTTQKWERRAGTVQARGEAAVEVPITADADTASTIAAIRGLIAWAETEKAKLSLPYRRAAVTPTDILAVTDDNGAEHRLRVGQIEDDSGVRLLEVTKERGNVYGATAAGAAPGTPNPPSGGGLVGPTIAHYMNLPSLRSSDTQPGIYAGVTGVLPGWQGADIYVSVDGGVSFQFAKRILSRATLGELAADCTASSEPITVTLYDNRSLSSITADQLAARQNAFAIVTSATAEIGQFQTTAENADEDWELTGTVRGGLGTTAAAHVAGDEWTLLDGAVQLVPVSVDYAGQTIQLKAVSIGASADDFDAASVVFSPPTFIIDGGSA